MNRSFAYLRRLLTAALIAAVVSLTSVFCMTAFAMDVKVSFSDPSAAVGDTVTVAMHVTSSSGEPLGSATIMLKYDPEALEFVSGDNTEGGAGSLKVLGQATTEAKDWMYGLNFKALKAGTSKIEISTIEIYDQSQKIATIAHQGSSAVTVTEGGGAAEAGQAVLSSLQVSPGTLSPSFAPDVREYRITVGDEVTRVAVSAPAADPNVKVTITGNEDLQMGENTINCNLSAADGSILGSYTIIAVKQEGETPTAAPAEAGSRSVTVDGSSYEIAESFDTTLLPEGYSAESYSFGGSYVTAGKSSDESLRMMYLLGADGSGDLFLYDEKSGNWAPYVEVGANARKITAVPMESGVAVPAALTESRLNLNGRPVLGWVGTEDNGENYCVFYGMNQDGDRGFYRFDLKEKTIQRYFTEQAEAKTGENGETETKPDPAYEELEKKYRTRGMMLIALILIAAIAVIAAILMAMRGGRGEDPQDPEDQDGGGDDGGQEPEFEEIAEEETEPEEAPRDIPEPFFRAPAGTPGFRPSAVPASAAAAAPAAAPASSAAPAGDDEDDGFEDLDFEELTFDDDMK